MAFESLPSPTLLPAQAPRWLRGLEVIKALTAHRTAAEAALALKISESSLLVELQQLQSSMRVQLFRPEGEVLELTEAGVALGPVAEAMLVLRDQYMATLATIAPAPQELTIGACTTAGNYILPVLLRTFRNVYPDVQVTMQVADSSSILSGVQQGKYAFGIVGKPPVDSQLQCEPFIDDEIVVIAPPGHPLMAGPELDLAELGAHPWVVREAGSATRSSLEVMLGQQLLGRRIWVALILESTEAIKLAVRVGDGIAFVSRRAVENELALGQLQARSLPGAGLMREFSLVRRKSQVHAFCSIELWNYLIASARDHELRRAW